MQQTRVASSCFCPASSSVAEKNTSALDNRVDPRQGKHPCISENALSKVSFVAAAFTRTTNNGRMQLMKADETPRAYEASGETGIKNKAHGRNMNLLVTSDLRKAYISVSDRQTTKKTKPSSYTVKSTYLEQLQVAPQKRSTREKS